MSPRQTFSKEERLCSHKLIDLLFRTGNRTTNCFPFRIVWLLVPESLQKGVSVLIVAPKKNLKHAVDRNKAKRQIRELYRTTGKEAFARVAGEKGCGLLLAIMFSDTLTWHSDKLSARFHNMVVRTTAHIHNSKAHEDT